MYVSKNPPVSWGQARCNEDKGSHVFFPYSWSRKQWVYSEKKNHLYLADVYATFVQRG